MAEDELTAHAADTPAKYAAQDKNGGWWLYEMKPYLLGVSGLWDSDGWKTLAARGIVPAGHDWRATLREVNPMTTTPNAPKWPAHPAHKAEKPQLNPATSSLTDSQARQFAEESGTCSDGTQCGTFAETAYCADCPNQPKVPTRQQMINRANSTLAFWPVDAEAANQIMPAKHPWQWRQSSNGDVYLTDLRFLQIVTESDWCAGVDMSEPQCLHYGGACGENGYCAPCPNRPQPGYDPDDVAFKQPRYQDARGEDWIDEFARTATMDEFRGAMRFTVGKYNRRIGKKDDDLSEVRKMRDYCERWEQYLLARR